MALILACPECQEKIKARDEAAGRKVRCPHCGAAVPVPKSSALDDEKVRSSPSPARESVRSVRAAPDRPVKPRSDSRNRDEYDDDDAYPRRSRRDRNQDRAAQPRSKAGLIIALCAGAGVLLIGGGVLFYFLLGRSGAPAVDRQAEMDMKVIGLAYHQHLDMFLKAPARIEDLQRVVDKDNPMALQRLRDGRFVFFWGVGIAQMPAGSGATILAHERDAPTRGGLVLFGDGSVRTISLDDFQKTAKAGGPNVVPPDPKQIDPKGSKGRDYTSESGAYSVTTPAGASIPLETKGPAPDGATNYMLQMEMPDKTAVQVMLTRFPAKGLSAAPPNGIIDGVRDRVSASLGGKLLGESSGRRDSFAYRDFDLSVRGNGKARIRVLVVNDDLYQMMVLGPANSPHQNDAPRFFDSLVLKQTTSNIPPLTNPDPKDNPADASNISRLMAAGKYKQAAELMEKLAQRSPASMRTRLRADAALAWLKADNKEQALALAKSAVGEPISSKSKIAKHRWHRALGEVFLATGQYPQAVEHLQRALDNVTTNSAARNECQKLLAEARAKNGM